MTPEELLQKIKELQLKIPLARQHEFLSHLAAGIQVIAQDYVQIPINEQIGEAYYTFRSDEEPDIVLKGLYKIKNDIKAPETLEIILYSKKTQVPNDANLHECWNAIANWDPYDYFLNPYMMRARLQGKSNLEVNSIVADISGVLNEVEGYKAPFLITKGTQPTDQQYMKRGRRYILSDASALS